MSACIVILAVWILLSGLDDLFIAVVFLATRRKPFLWPDSGVVANAPERPIAILVPLWHEHRVIGRMLERNLAGVRYGNYVFFVGVYPNDPATCRAVAEAATRDPRVHLSMTGHDGPTSKGDCLNWIYHRMQSYERAHGVRFEVVMTHDAEDLMHPDSLRWINWFSQWFAMVQLPVLPLPTGAAEFTHGLYCDEFAEYQSKDIPVRQRLGGFLPSNGVGAGFSRGAMERLAEERNGMVFDPDSLTEDYETGYRLHALGFAQIFVPLRFDLGAPVATREYFPRSLRTALRQRSRWVAGIALQGWQRHGWRTTWRQAYWLWRDRKGVIGNLLTPFANGYLVYGVTRYFEGHPPDDLPLWLGAGTIGLAAFHAVTRTLLTARIYGWSSAAAAPSRILWGNLVNFLATALAVGQFARARIRRKRLAWTKTDHAFPVTAITSDAALRIGEVLVRMNCLSLLEMEVALRSIPRGIRIGEHLVQLQIISEDNLYQALSSRAGIPMGVPMAIEFSRPATRSLPVAIARRWKVLPYRVAVGALHVLTADVPSAQMAQELGRASSLEVCFRLVRPWELEALARQYLPEAVA